MQELHLVGFTTDLEQLIFSVRKGAKSGGYTVSLDEQLLTVIAEAVRMRRAIGADVSGAAATVEAAVREGAAATTAKAESALSPREIQARLRAGRSVKQVAKAAGVTEAWVERFAAPVRGEQGQIAARARSMVFSKPRLGDSAEPLGLSVRWNVADKGVRFTEAEFDEHWSAYQFQDHVWVIRFAFESRKREHVAEWMLDLEAGELEHRNRLASDLGYLEPGKRRKVQDLAPDPAEVKTEPRGEEDDDEPARLAGRRGSKSRGASAARSGASGARTLSPKKAGAKRSSTRKPNARTSAGKRAGARKTAAKKTAARKTAARKTAARKTAAKKTAAKKTAAKKTAAKKTAAKKTAAKKSGARKTAAKKVSENRAGAKKAPARNSAAPAPRRSVSARPPAEPASPSASPWRSLTAGNTAPSPASRRPAPQLEQQHAAPPPDEAPRPPQARRQAPPGRDPDGAGDRSAPPSPPAVQPFPRSSPAPLAGGAGDGSASAPADRAARRAARRGRLDEPAPAGARPLSPEPQATGGTEGDALPAARPGQVVTIRANRATPPLAERRSEEATPRPSPDVEEGIVGEPRPLRPAMQARSPRRRRYGNRT